MAGLTVLWESGAPWPFLSAPPWQEPRLFWEQMLAGVAAGGIYGLLALAMVLMFRSTGVINFAIGEMAMLVTFVSWSLTQAGLSLWEAMPVGVALGAAMGVMTERTMVRPLARAPVLSIVVVTLGLFSLLNGVAISIWAQGDLPKRLDSPLVTRSIDLGVARMSQHHAVVLGAAALLSVLLLLLFTRTKLGLAMRASAENPVASQLVGINVGRMRAVSWGLSTALGSLAGLLIAPITLVWPGFMFPVLLYAMTAAVLGGLTSAPGAVLCGVAVGVAENLLGTYTPQDWLGPEMKLPLVLMLLAAVLVARPAGIWGRAPTRKV